MRDRSGEARKPTEAPDSPESIYRRAFHIGLDLAMNWVLADVAEDLAQKVAVELYWRLMKGEAAPLNLRHYVHRSIWFNAQKHYKRLRTRRRPFQLSEVKRADVQREWMHPEAAHDLGVTEEKLRTALDRLPKGQLAVVKLIVLDGLEYEEAALQLGLKGGTVRVQMARALKTLRRALGVRQKEPE